MCTALITRCRTLLWLFPDKDSKIYCLSTNSAHNFIIQEEQRYVVVPNTNHHYCMIAYTQIVLTFRYDKLFFNLNVYLLTDLFTYTYMQRTVNILWQYLRGDWTNTCA